MTLWKSFGASVRGPGHITTGTANQDAWSYFHHTWGDGIVVSDGVGSKPLSNFGSDAACRAVESAALVFSGNTDIKLDLVFKRIRDNWLSHIAPLEPADCSATCLFAFRLGDGLIQLGMLGDGLAAVAKTDGSVVFLSEDKTNGFSNITLALSPNSTSKDWQHLSLLEEECLAILLCTDGVSDDLENIDGFVKGVIDAYCPLATVRANQYLREMLENWPAPKHSDDKTIACLCRGEIENG